MGKGSSVARPPLRTRLLAIIMAVVLSASMIPTSAFADGGSASQQEGVEQAATTDSTSDDVANLDGGGLTDSDETIGTEKGAAVDLQPADEADAAASDGSEEGASVVEGQEPPVPAAPLVGEISAFSDEQPAADGDGTLRTVDIVKEHSFTKTYGASARAALNEARVQQSVTALANGIRNAIKNTSLSSDRIWVNVDNIKPTVAELEKAIDQVWNDPEFYYLGTQMGYMYYDTPGVSISDKRCAQGYVDLARPLNQLTAYRQKIEEGVYDALSWVSNTMTPLQKVQALHDYLVITCVYDSAGSDDIFTCYGALVDKRCVCDGFSKAYRLLLSRIGISAVRVESDEMNHAWNMVQLDGSWYHVDLTWDDNLAADSGSDSYYGYFLVSDATLGSDHHDWTVVHSAASDYAVDRDALVPYVGPADFTNYPAHTPTATSLGSGAIKLVWGAFSVAKKYEVYRSDTENGTFMKIAEVTKPEYTDASVTKQQSYFYKVKAVSDSATSAFSKAVKATAGIDMAATAVALSSVNFNYNGRAQTPAVTVKYGGSTLRPNVDYTVAYASNINIGTAKVTVTGKGGYYGSKTVTFRIVKAPVVAYSTHVQNIGWQKEAVDGARGGTSGRALRVEAFKVRLASQPYGGGIEVQAHVQNIGWQGWAANGALSGTFGRALRVEALRIRLTGDMAKYYDVYYRTHVQNVGDTGWAKNGESCGSAGYAYRMEAVYIKLVPKGQPAPGSTANCFVHPLVTYQTHVQNIGWQKEVSDGATGGTSGRGLRVEAFKVSLNNQAYPGSIRVMSHVQNIGWQNWRYDGALSGTSGRALRVEALCIELTGEMKNRYDVYYRTHVQNIGWTGWAKNGVPSGSAGYAYRMEAVQIKLVPKGGKAPGTTARPFYQR